jgi:hypothetical protein
LITDLAADTSMEYLALQQFSTTDITTTAANPDNANMTANTTLPQDYAAPPPPQTSAKKGEPDQFFPFLWYSYSVHESLNILDNCPLRLPYSASYLTMQGTPSSEIQEYLHCRHAFPHVPQLLYPSTRPDGIAGQYYHLTQLPQNSEIDFATGLAPTYQVTIRFDTNYHNMTKIEVQQAAHARLEQMRISLANRFRKPIAALVTQSGWMGFLKLDLLNPASDGLALLKGHRIFTLQLQNGEYVVGKAEKGFEFNSTAINRRLRMQSPALSNLTSRQLLAELIKLGYSSGNNLEFIGVSKRTKEQTTADITIAAENTMLYLRQYPLLLQGERIRITTPSLTPSPNLTSKDSLTTTLIVKGLPLQYSQLQVTIAIHRLLAAKNVVSIHYTNAEEDDMGRHEGSAIINCLNAAVYTHWSNKMVVPLLGKMVDFIPHRRSLAGANPSAASRAHDARPTREVIADEINALQNQTALAPSLQQLESSLKGVEDRIEARLNGLRETINLHTTATTDAAVTASMTRQDYLLRQLQELTTASQEYNRKMIGISSAIIQGQDPNPQATIATIQKNTTHD